MRLGLRASAVAQLAAAMFAAGPGNWVPARWQGGPVELRRRPVAAEAEIIRDWYSPRTLDLLDGTPVNCLLVTWSASSDAALESEHQKLVADYANAAHERKIAVLGLIYPEADATRSARRAAEAGLDGVVLDGDFPDAARVARELRKVIPLVISIDSRNRFSADPDRPVLATSDAVTPRIRPVPASGSVDATPTTEPWIDSNTWLVRALRAGSDARPVWLGQRLEHPSEEDYARAIADAAVGGGRWVLAPDDSLMASLWRKQAGALAAWNRIAAHLDFQEQHAEWRAFTPAAALGIVQDRAGQHSDMSDENLNLITRRRIPYRVIERTALSSAALKGLPMLLAANLAPPTAMERKLLADYSAAGGQVVEFKGDPPDPETLSKDLLELVGNENLPVRLFNASSVLAQVSAAPDGSRLLVQLINYATVPSDLITVRATGAYRGARLLNPDAPPVQLRTTISGGKTGVRITTLGVYAAVLFEK